MYGNIKKVVKKLGGIYRKKKSILYQMGVQLCNIWKAPVF